MLKLHATMTDHEALRKAMSREAGLHGPVVIGSVAHNAWASPSFDACPSENTRSCFAELGLELGFREHSHR